jgi:alpha-D-ribose 1-methylphosphonate 5-triphosphate synthase subunit PhnI
MGYVATRGGVEAVLKAEELVEYFRLKGGSAPITPAQIQDQLRLAVDRAMHEGALYAPELAALAVKQSEGDAIEASFLLRAYRSTVPRLTYSLPARGGDMRVLRRISSTFKDIPGGQLLGPTRDYQPRLLNTLLENETAESVREFLSGLEEQANAENTPPGDGRYPKVIESMRAQNLLAEATEEDKAETGQEPSDVTRKAISFPATRSARLQVLARGDVGSLLAFAYSSVRGYGDVHPTLGELRVGYLPVEVTHPLTGEPVEIGEILVTECEMVSRVHASGEDRATPKFGLGYGFTFGHSEVKALSIAILDRAISAAKAANGHSAPATHEEFVLQHIDAVEASGFTAHFKLPHYVTFQADISVLERSREYKAGREAEKAERQEKFKRKFSMEEADEDEE